MAQGTPTEQQQGQNPLEALIANPGIRTAGLTAGLGLLFGLKPEQALQAGAAAGVSEQQGAQKIQDLMIKQRTELKARDQKISQDLRKEYQGNEVVKDFAKINSAVTRMNTVWEDFQSRPDEGSRNALDQALVITFNKMLDPGSVVRESEFARTPQGLSLLRKIGAAADKLAKGGVGLDDSERSEIVRASQLLAQGQQKEALKVQGFYREETIRSGIDPIRVVMPFDEIPLSKLEKAEERKAEKETTFKGFNIKNVLTKGGL